MPDQFPTLFTSPNPKLLPIDASEQYSTLSLGVSKMVTRPLSLNFGRNPLGPKPKTLLAKLTSRRKSTSRTWWCPDARNRSTRLDRPVSREDQNWPSPSRTENGLNTIFWMSVEAMVGMSETCCGIMDDKVNVSLRSLERFSSVWM